MLTFDALMNRQGGLQQIYVGLMPRQSENLVPAAKRTQYITTTESVCWSDIKTTRKLSSYLKENIICHHYKDQVVGLTLSCQPEHSDPTSKKIHASPL
jgi:hypothetical protein